MKKVMLFGLLVAAILLVSVAANATIYTLTDQNSSLTIDPSSQAGAYSWIVNGNSNLYQQWFWYNINSTKVTSLDQLAAPAVSLLGTTELTAEYAGTGLDVKVKYDLTGTSGNASDVAETITLKNTSTASETITFYQYSDFDLMNSPSGDMAQLVTANEIMQWKAANPTVQFSETVVTRSPVRYDISAYDSTLLALNSGASSLDIGQLIPIVEPAAVGPGDMTWAFQWNLTIAPGQSLIISKDKSLTVPEPGTLLFLGLGLVGLAAAARRKFARK